ncbi:Golgi to ER traffic protein 4 homolog [Atheta coriaria]|uniref:Golgi to ER traffic protein 4 homolog n=1 Tax=Dalotia coriaria TaxID=877792 RepID=UPI0031F46128
MASQANARGVSRVLEKLENSVKNGKYYEAHQMYRTMYFRYLSQEKFTELMDMLYNGAILFLDHDQHISGADLGILLVQVLTQANNKDYKTWIPKLCSIFAKISTNTPERDTFLGNAIRWSSANALQGHPQLHQNVAQIYWNEKNYHQARYHYLHSKDGQGCAKLLIEFQMTQGYGSEVDLFIAQTVFQFLCMRNERTANLTFASYTAAHPGIKRSGPPYLLPLLNFLWFLLKAIESKKLATFVVLCQQYEVSIKRDPCYKQYLDKIGQIFFDVKPPPQHSNHFFGNFLQSFLGGLDDDSDDEAGASFRPSASSSRRPVETAELD